MFVNWKMFKQSLYYKHNYVIKSQALCRTSVKVCVWTKSMELSDDSKFSKIYVQP